MFDRWRSWFPRSFAYSRFKEHHTEINDLYWSLVPVAGFAEYLARHAPLGATPTSLFHVSGVNARRVSPDLNGWQRNFSDFQNWVRLSSLLSALSYFESYFSTASTLALRSDPLLRFDQSKALDGTIWLKKRVKDDVSTYVTPLVKGEWPTRISAYRGLFGTIPSTLQNEIGRLDQMRLLRNGVAHSFGRDARFFEDPMIHAGQPARLSEQRLQEWLSTIEACAEAVDQHLFPSHIGEFELIWRYHRWRYEPRNPLDRTYTSSRAFSRVITRDYGTGPGGIFCKELIAYYDAL